MKFRLLVLAISIPIFFSSACGMKRMSTSIMGKVATDGIVSLEGEEDVSFAKESAPSLIKTLEVLSYGNPDDRRSLVLLSRSYALFSFGFLEEELLANKVGTPQYEDAKRRMELFYNRGKEYGLRALARGSLKKSIKGPFQDFAKGVSTLGKGHVDAMFWTAFNWANLVNQHRDDPQSIADLPRIGLLIDRVLKLAPEYYYSSAHAFKGVLEISRPKMLGGNHDLAKREFEEAIKAAPNMLMTKVLMAQYYAKAVEDDSLYSKLLLEVEAGDAKAVPALRLANELAKRRAKLLMKK